MISRETQKNVIFTEDWKTRKYALFYRKNALESRVFRKNYVLYNFEIYRKWPVRCFLIFCSFHSLVLFVGRNDGFNAWNNDNFFKILWSNLINFDKKDEIYQISIMVETKEGERVDLNQYFLPSLRRKWWSFLFCLRLYVLLNHVKLLLERKTVFMK